MEIIDRCALRGRVLLVEDDDDLRPLLAEILEREQIEVVSVRNGAEAVMYLGTMLQNPDLVPIPDLLITDLCMPYLDGFSVLDQWPLPALVITSFNDAEVHDRARQLGVSLLTKPFALAEFQKAVDRLLSC